MPRAWSDTPISTEKNAVETTIRRSAATRSRLESATKLVPLKCWMTFAATMRPEHRAESERQSIARRRKSARRKMIRISRSMSGSPASPRSSRFLMSCRMRSVEWL